MLIYDRQKWGDFWRGEEIPLLVLSLKILIAVDFPPSYFRIPGGIPPSSAGCLSEQCWAPFAQTRSQGPLLFPAPLRAAIHLF